MWPVMALVNVFCTLVSSITALFFGVITRATREREREGEAEEKREREEREEEREEKRESV